MQVFRTLYFACGKMDKKTLKKATDILLKDPFVISDTHFFHDRVFTEFEPSRKEFAKSRELFDDKMLKLLSKSSPLLHLGDVCMNSRNRNTFEKRVFHVGQRLDGLQKVLIPGNHDMDGLSFYEKTGWFVLSHGMCLLKEKTFSIPDSPPFLFIDMGRERIFFSHEPVLSGRERTRWDGEQEEKLTNWFKKLDASLNVHGHLHSRKIPSPSFQNVSVEVLSFQPARLSTLVKETVRKNMSLEHEGP